ncbi:MAG: serine/threonine-protein kinase [Kofleriaceae bacterium]
MSGARGPSESRKPLESTVIEAPDPDDVPTIGANHASGRRKSPSLGPGMMVGDYRIEEKIGEGGMGEVYSAVHPLISKRAAIKLLRREMCSDPGAVERFIDEARVVNQIGHPNLVDIFTFGQLTDGRHYLVMEWLKGESLRTRLTRGPIGFEEVCAILRPLGKALEAAHAAGVVHRDLKPDNIFLVDVRDEPPQVKLLDFGIAKLANTDHRMEQTRSGAIVGTPKYIAPEQAKGLSVDHRSDIYSLGGIAFEMFTGRPPFVANSAMEVVSKHLVEPPVAPSTLVSGLPREIDALVLCMLAKEPADRPSLPEILSALERHRTNPSVIIPRLATSAGAGASAELAANGLDTAVIASVRTRKPWVILGGTAVVSGVLATFLALSTSDRSIAKPPSQAHQPIDSPATVAPSPPPAAEVAPEPAQDPVEVQQTTGGPPEHEDSDRRSTRRKRTKPARTKATQRAASARPPKSEPIAAPTPPPPPAPAPEPAKPKGIGVDGLFQPGSFKKGATK